MTKIIGFLVTKENIQLSVDFFHVGINILTINHNNYNVYLWGIGDIKDYIIDNKYSLSFPLKDTLLDRNILIGFEDEKIIIENDWLGSIPIFYNQKEQIISTLSNFCLKDKTINQEGLSNFCEFGYSVFEQTMFEDVKFMRYYSKLIVSENIEVEYKKDPILDTSFLEHTSTVDEVIDSMKEYISDIENKIDGDILLPTSGGYDSRILNYLVRDKSRIQSFTYGISQDQSKSSEVVHAKKISEIYNTKWEQIELNDYHQYINKWTDIYGFSTHLHGMYHIEFYAKILEKHKFSNASFLSGIFGDIWSGSINYKAVENYKDVISLGYTHGMKLDLLYLNNFKTDEIKKQYFNNNIEYLANDKIKAILTIRIKMLLISYLIQIPEYFGMPVWTPFLNFDIAKATLNLPDKKRKNRIWQRDFFRRVKLNLEDMNLKSVKSNKLDYEIAKKAKLEPIDVRMMMKYIDENRLVEINNIILKLTIFESLKNKLLYVPKIGGVLRRLGFQNEFLKALYEYYVIKAIEKGMKHES